MKRPKRTGAEPSERSANKVDLSSAYQLRLVSGVLSSDPRLVPVLDLIAPEHFSVPGITQVWETIIETTRACGHVPTRELLREALWRKYREPSERAFFTDFLKKCQRKLRDVEIVYLVQHAREFADLQRLIIACRDAIPHIERRDLTKAQEVLGRALIPPSGSNQIDRWRSIPLSELRAPRAEESWLWSGYLLPGASTLLVGFWKAGKTTLVSYLLRALSPDGDGSRDFAGQAVQPCRVLIVTEESALLWKRRRDQLGLGDHVRIVTRPFRGRSQMADWLAFLTQLVDEIRTHKISLVVFDSLPNLWPVSKENDTGEVLAAIQPCTTILGEAGAAVLFLHHPRREAAEGQASRGAGALPAHVDIILEFKRYDGARHEDTRRVLSALSRFDETPRELVLSFEEGMGYTTIGTRADIKIGDRLGVVREVLGCSKSKTVEDLLKHWPKGTVPKPGRSTLQRDLDTAFKNGTLRRIGAGTRSHPYRYTNAIRPGVSPRPGAETNRISQDFDSDNAIRPSPGCRGGTETNNGHGRGARQNGANPIIREKMRRTLAAIEERRRLRQARKQSATRSAR